ncbi:flagellar basal-body MS-ring/collar protein FliF [Buchnera aphidicola]|uniref:flagellar basal-body MS-ring/collar protein FliF n=1 Tax=Buchnera aphidicola TaxID=9 RepID=UPI00094DB264|nr:flagellar basal-body MS-ring/collar protein FliF [Buchnera aphidicola]
MKIKNKIVTTESTKYWNNIFLYFLKNFQFFMVFFSFFLSFIIVFILWFNNIHYSVLYDHLSNQDEFWVVSQLQSMKIPYKFNNISGSLSVPENRIHELRFKLLNNNLNKEKIYGFDFLNNDKFNISQFNEKLNYHRGLEGELSKTLMNIFPIKYARVHLSYQKNNDFLQKKEIPSAAVVVTLYPDTYLKKNQIDSISSLISGSISHLSADHIVIIDHNGNLLNQLSLNLKRFFNNDIKKKVDFLKDYYLHRINEILRPLLGSKNFIIQINPHIISCQERRNIVYKDKKHNKKIPDLLNLVPEYLNNLGITKKNNFLKNVSSHICSKKIKPIVTGMRKNINSQSIRKIFTVNNSIPDKKILKLRNSNNNSSHFFGIRKKNIEKYNTDFYPRTFRNSLISFSVRILVNYKKNSLGKLIPLTVKEIKDITNMTKSAMNFSNQHGDFLQIINILFFTSKKDIHINSFLFYKNLIFSYKFFIIFFFFFVFFFILMRKIIERYIKNNNIVKGLPFYKERSFSQSDNSKQLFSIALRNKNILLNSKHFFNNKKKLDIDPKIIAKVIRLWMKNK